MSGNKTYRFAGQREILIFVLFASIFNGAWKVSGENVLLNGKYKFKNIVEEADVQSEIGKVNEGQIPSVCQPVQWSDKNCQVGPVSIKVDIAEPVFHQLCPHPSGKYEAPSSCDLYIVCHGQSLTVNRCPSSYHFNSKLQSCVEAQLYECSHPVIHDASSLLNGTTTVGKKSKEKLSFAFDFGNPKSKAVESHVITKRSIKSNGNCPADYIRPHPVTCTKFLICSNGKFYDQNCGEGTKFNPLSNVCDLPDNVDCDSRITDLGTYDCQPNYVYITSHYLYCNKFIECDHGVLHVKNCPPNLVFNAETSRCDYKDNYPCEKPVFIDHDTDVNYIRRSRDVSKYACEFNYIAPIEGVCDEFLECEGTKLFRKSCGPGTAYNVLLGQCDWPHNVRAPDRQYCSRYLQCNGKNYEPRECPPGDYFNAGTGQCDSAEIVDCSGKLDDPRPPRPRPPQVPVTPPPRTTPIPRIINSK